MPVTLTHSRAFVKAVELPEDLNGDYRFEVIECMHVAHDTEAEDLGRSDFLRVIDGKPEGVVNVSAYKIRDAFNENPELSSDPDRITTFLFSMCGDATAEDMIEQDEWDAFHISFLPAEYTH